MKTRKFVAALLVLTMVVALCSTAFALTAGTTYKFTNTTYGYNADKTKSNVIIKKGSFGEYTGRFIKINGEKKVEIDFGNGTVLFFPEKYISSRFIPSIQGLYLPLYGAGGNNVSRPLNLIPDQYPSMKKVVVTGGSVNVRKTYALRGHSLGTVHKGDKLRYLHQMGVDTRGVIFYKVKFGKKVGWISGVYLKGLF